MEEEGDLRTPETPTFPELIRRNTLRLSSGISSLVVLGRSGPLSFPILRLSFAGYLTAVQPIIFHFGPPNNSTGMAGAELIFTLEGGPSTENLLGKVKSLLLESGAPLKPPGYTWTALHAAAKYKCGSAVMELLLENGADATEFNDYGQTPLHLATLFNAGKEVVALLIDHGSPIDALDKYGRTALACAVSQKACPEVIGLLLAAGANPQVVTDDTETESHSDLLTEARDLALSAFISWIGSSDIVYGSPGSASAAAVAARFISRNPTLRHHIDPEMSIIGNEQGSKNDDDTNTLEGSVENHGIESSILRMLQARWQMLPSDEVQGVGEYNIDDDARSESDTEDAPLRMPMLEKTLSDIFDATLMTSICANEILDSSTTHIRRIMSPETKKSLRQKLDSAERRVASLEDENSSLKEELELLKDLLGWKKLSELVNNEIYPVSFENKQSSSVPKLRPSHLALQVARSPGGFLSSSSSSSRIFP